MWVKIGQCGGGCYVCEDEDSQCVWAGRRMRPSLDRWGWEGGLESVPEGPGMLCLGAWTPSWAAEGFWSKEVRNTGLPVINNILVADTERRRVGRGRWSLVDQLPCCRGPWSGDDDLIQSKVLAARAEGGGHLNLQLCARSTSIFLEAALRQQEQMFLCMIWQRRCQVGSAGRHEIWIGTTRKHHSRSPTVQVNV